MHWIDATIVVAFAGYAVTSGFLAQREASRSLNDYFLAGRTLAGWQAGLSMAATQFAADTPLLVTGLVATAGIFSLWRLWIYAVAFLLLGFVLAASWRRAAVLTDAELTELRYAGRYAAILRAIKAIYFGAIFNCTVVAMVLFATKEIAEPFLTWDRWLPSSLFQWVERLVQAVGVPLASSSGQGDVWVRTANNIVSIFLLVGTTALYSMTGGLRSVVRTDVMQLFVMLGGTAAYAYCVIERVGGLGALHTALAKLYVGGPPTGLTSSEIVAFTPSRAHDAGLALLAAFGLQWLVQMNSDGTGYLAQRTMACRSERDARAAAVVFTVVQVLLRSLLWLPIALGLLVLFPPDPSLGPELLKAEREATFVRGMRELLPPGVLGLMLTAMLAALASTIDTHLNWGASYFTNDLYDRFYCRAWRKRSPTEQDRVRVGRVSNVLLLLASLGIMTELSSIQVAWQASLLLGAGMGTVLLLRWFWWRITAQAEIAAIVASLVLAPILILTEIASDEAVRLLAMALGSTSAALVVCWVGRAEPLEQLAEFYSRAHPPGFWGPVASFIGAPPGGDRRRLARGLAATGVAAVSLFSVLTALGSWIAGSPPPVWWPASRMLYLAGLAALGAGLAPLWFRLGFRGEPG